MTFGRKRAPLWFWIVAIVFLAWSATGLLAFYMDVSGANRAGLDAYTTALLDARPGWYLWVYGIAVWAGAAGAVLLLMRRPFAVPLFVLSLAGVVVMFGHTFLMTDLVAVKGVGTAIFPLFITAMAVAQIAVARVARKSGWLR